MCKGTRMLTHADAFPRKRFFLEMFTRDISVEDCILDLIDNSIDALIRTRNVDVEQLLLAHGAPAAPDDLPLVQLQVTDQRLRLTDRCGGIPEEIVAHDLFSFGHSDRYKPGVLGAYGIGMKRALFKLGEHFELRSRTRDGGFTVALDVADWARNDRLRHHWQVPVGPGRSARSLRDAGTDISISRLRSDVKQRLRDPMTLTRLQRNVAQAYTLFLERAVRIEVNESPVHPDPLPLGESLEVRPGIERYTDGGVDVILMASLATRDAQGNWSAAKAGWYVFCNGRLVVPADKSDLTGWGSVLPQWHSKYMGFLGVAFFSAPNPLDLPWTTTKRGLNWESPVYQEAKNRMVALSRPVLNFLNRMYSSELPERPGERDMAQGVELARVGDVATRAGARFTAPARRARGRDTVSVQFTAATDDVERAKKRLDKPNWGAGRVGKHCFDHFLKRECP